ncbi:Phytanoyl-CoA dioxygenase (PhyH) [Seminavis robusta]|uniref:Phytanoyl-CoA dioxygenase (PhyH) n=1 Tax=Seminavis robusta TaxID=568900 RepID=A0A9N8H4K7_9STRA|nr:Phytanoyl-CoA dioxygenase (PhyH) [Seminavis robusta]|eukprot:Sro10_g007790.1 Phytanoyl-CoA dioxygenase (PhyH) (603) ;mRNA; f:6530-8405
MKHRPHCIISTILLLSRCEPASSFLLKTRSRSESDGSPPPVLHSLQSTLADVSSGADSSARILPLDRTTSKGIPVNEFPFSVSIAEDQDPSLWMQQAARFLREHGVCVLTHVQSGSVIHPSHCQAAEEAALSRISTLKQWIETNHGIDPNGRDDGPFRFREVVSRDNSGGRYDMSVPWKGDPKNNHGIPLSSQESMAINQFHTSLEETVQPILDLLWSSNSNSSNNVATASGFLINQPGSTDQTWHRDGPVAGWINVFVPLVDLTIDMGPTERGQILLMDYRTFHRGLGNACPKGTTRTVAYAVYNRGASASLGDKLSYGLLPRAYASIDTNAASDTLTCRGEDIPFLVKMEHKRHNVGIQKSATLLQRDGVCVLQQDTVIAADEAALCDNNMISTEARARLDDLKQRIINRGLDPEEFPFRFKEIACRDEGRFNLPSPWEENPSGNDSSKSASESKLQAMMMDDMVRPILDSMWGKDGQYYLAESGVLVSEPGSPSQPWHRDACEEGSVHVLCPLLTTGEGQEVGPVELWPGSHAPAGKDTTRPTIPLLQKGQIMLTDSRMLYQYRKNTSEEKPLVWGYAVWQKGNLRAGQQSGGLTLEYD